MAEVNILIDISILAMWVGSIVVLASMAVIIGAYLGLAYSAGRRR